VFEGYRRIRPHYHKATSFANRYQEIIAGEYTGMKLKDKIGIFPIMRAGNGMVSAFLEMLPTATVHHLGLFREKVMEI
jgi:uracil phosphoribosyltransferase